MPFLLCLHHCQLASCPAHPEAECTVDPCRMCKVEFKDSSGNVVNCSESKYIQKQCTADFIKLPKKFKETCKFTNLLLK